MVPKVVARVPIAFVGGVVAPLQSDFNGLLSKFAFMEFQEWTP